MTFEGSFLKDGLESARRLTFKPNGDAVNGGAFHTWTATGPIASETQQILFRLKTDYPNILDLAGIRVSYN